VLAEKDVDGILRVLLPGIATAVATAVPSPRGLPPSRLAEEIGRRSGAPVEAVAEPVEALARARARAREDDLVLVAGSTYLAGALRSPEALEASLPPRAG
jgi:folylpolyglutamate synthase/dihydropteroate synthase